MDYLPLIALAIGILIVILFVSYKFFFSKTTPEVPETKPEVKAEQPKIEEKKKATTLSTIRNRLFSQIHYEEQKQREYEEEYQKKLIEEQKRLVEDSQKKVNDLQENKEQLKSSGVFLGIPYGEEPAQEEVLKTEK